MDLVTGPIGSIISKLTQLLAAEYKLQAGVKQRIESLTRELESAHAFLQEIDEVPPDQLNEQVRIWACDVREASYDMEDVLDTFLDDKDPKPVNKNKNKLKRLKEKIGTLFSKTVARHDIANAIEEVNKKLKEIAERRQRYKIDDCVASPATPSSRIDPRIAWVHRTSASTLIGIDESKEAVIKMLSHDDMKTRVVSVLGFGGLGKTTLAKATYDQLKQNYECGAFVSVGRNPDLVKVFKDILYDLDKDNSTRDIHSTQKGADFLIRQLLDFLRDKRYLIVIDDVWETQSKKRIIDDVLSTENNKGSGIIITTRNSEVATGDEVYKYKLQPLSYDNSRELFYKRIFGGEDKCPDNQRQKVSEVADKILKKCDGVPLAIITMASLLVGKSMQEWYEVCNSIGFRDKDKEQVDDTLWILSLSYYDLPSHLKTCLLYLSVFPEDYLIKKDALIWMWVAEGFVNEKPGIGLYEIGEGYFNNLVNRSLIQPVEEEENGIIDGCRIHDMILDLIRSLSREANFAMVFDNSTEDTLLGSNARRLALHNDAPLNNHTDTARARSFFAFAFTSKVQLRSKLLRVLYLEGSCQRFDRAILEDIGDLHHLRYLGTSRLYGLELPKEEAFKFLRVLYLEGGTMELLKARALLPSSVVMLTQLVCLCALFYSLPGGEIKNLTSLQQLYIQSGTTGKSTDQFVKDLGNLRELRVLRIFICRFKDKRMQSDFVKSLGNLHKLQRLHLVTYQDEALSHLVLLPRGLCHLFLRTVPEFPPCIDPTRLPILSHLTLDVHEMGDKGLKILGELPELHYLMLRLSTRCSSTATITGTAAHGYFQKLRSCLLQNSTVQFVVNEEDSSVSFTIWTPKDDDASRLIGFKKKQDSCRVAGALMPNLEVLRFLIVVKELTDCKNGSCDNLGLECLPSLQKLTVTLDCSNVPDEVADKEEAALRHTIQAHPNQPTLEIYGRKHYSSSKSDNDDLT